MIVDLIGVLLFCFVYMTVTLGLLYGSFKYVVWVLEKLSGRKL